MQTANGERATARARGRRSKPGARAQGAPAPGPALMGIAAPDSGWFSLSEECHLHGWVSCRHWMDKAQFGFRRGNAPSRKRWVCATSSLQKPEKKVPLASESSVQQSMESMRFDHTIKGNCHVAVWLSCNASSSPSPFPETLKFYQKLEQSQNMHLGLLNHRDWLVRFPKPWQALGLLWTEHTIPDIQTQHSGTPCQSCAQHCTAWGRGIWFG